MLKVLFIDNVHHLLSETLEREGFECIYRTKSSYEDLVKVIHLYDGIVLRSRVKIDEVFINAAINLQFIARVGSGMENIDVKKAEEKNITCINSPEGNSNSVAEHLTGMLLTLLNNLNKANNEVKKGIWYREENRGVELEGKTIGIIGYGNTGMAFAKCLRGFNVRILAYDKYKVGFRDDWVNESTINKIKQESDIISLHVPLTHETKYYVDDDFFNSLVKPIYLLNSSRGFCVNTNSLVNNLKIGKVLGACLDVLEYETTSFNKINTSSYEFNYLIRSNNVILSPHIAGWSKQSNKKNSKILAKKIIDKYK